MEPSAYLAAKRSVDDRAIDRGVWERFEAALGERASRRLRVLDAGAGVGAMAARIADWMTLSTPVAYRGADVDRDAIALGRDRLPVWLRAAGYHIRRTEDTLVATGPSEGDARLEVTLEVADVRDLDWSADAVIAAALMDIVKMDPMLATFRELLRPGGLLYAPLTFDGCTEFRPAVAEDREIVGLYHRHMDEVRDRPGSSRAGRDLREALPGAGFDGLLEAPSTWEIRPTNDGYPGNEAVVLAYLLDTIEGALAEYPADVLPPRVRREWIAARREQLERAELSARVRHRDVLAKARR